MPIRTPPYCELRLRLSVKWMILTTMAEIMTTRISVQSHRQAMDWSLVLVSQGIETFIDSSDEIGWGLIVPEQDYGRALEILRQYRAENRRWPWRQKISPKGVLFDWGSVGWVGVLSLFFWIETQSGPNFRSAGLMDALAVSRGEWWRLFTAIVLHADLGHLAMNASIGFLLLGLVMGNFGTGAGLLAAYLCGAGGNVTTWLIFSEGHRSLGASGMVMGCVGLLAAQSFSFNHGNRGRLKYSTSGFVGGIMLFAASDHRLAQQYEVAQIFSTLSERFETTRRALNDIADRLFSIGDADYSLAPLLGQNPQADPENQD